MDISRRSLLKTSGLAVGSTLVPHGLASALEAEKQETVHLNLNENAWGPSARVAPAVEREFSRLSRYADAALANNLVEQIAAYENVPVEQVIPGEILGGLGLWLGSQKGPGGEFLYSTPGYTALVDAAAHVGGVAVPVPLNQHYENDLPALRTHVNEKTRAIYLINPHNPTGTVSEKEDFLHFVREASQQVPVIVDEAYLEYTSDFAERSAVSLVRQGADVLVFRTFDKIHGLAGLPIGYTLAPAATVKALRQQGYGDAESLGRLNIAAAAAALSDRQHVERVRLAVAEERRKWFEFLKQHGRSYTETLANFIFFDAGEPQTSLAQALRQQGVEIGRTFPPYTNWARITIGLPEENQKVQRLLATHWG